MRDKMQNETPERNLRGLIKGALVAMGLIVATLSFIWVSNAQFPNPGAVGGGGTPYIDTSGVASGDIDMDGHALLDATYIEDNSAAPAGSGLVRGGNATNLVCAELATPGTDKCLSTNSSDQFVSNADFTVGTNDLLADELRPGSGNGGVFDCASGTDGRCLLKNAAGTQSTNLSTDASNNLVITAALLTGSGGLVTYSGGNPLSAFDGSNFSANSSMSLRWFSSNPIVTGSYDTSLSRAAAAIIGVTSMFQFTEVSEPAAPAANKGTLFMQDNGAGKSQLCVRFNSGVSQCFATEP
jgi:hypothetical protein